MLAMLYAVRDLVKAFMCFSLPRFSAARRSERRRRDPAAEREALQQPDLRRHEGGLLAGLAGADRQRPAARGAPTALLPAATPLGRCRRALHRHLLPEPG